MTTVPRPSGDALSPVRHGLILTLAVAALVATVLAAPGTAAPTLTGGQTSSRWFPQGFAVYDVIVTKKRVYVGGDFDSVRNARTGQRVPASNLAAFDRSSGRVLKGWDGGTNGPVRALALSKTGSRLLVGGDFSQVRGAPRDNLAAVKTRGGGVVGGWNPGVTGQVRDLVRRGNRLYLAGTFSAVSGARRIGLAALRAKSGGLVADWRADVDGGRPFALAVLGSSLVTGGTFKRLGGAPRRYLGSVALADGETSTWRPEEACRSCLVFDVAAGGGRAFAAAGGEGGGRAIAYDAGTNSARWTANADGDVQTVVARNGQVYIGGHFAKRIGGERRSQLAVADAGSGQIGPLSVELTRPTPGVRSIVPRANQLFLGGGFTLNGKDRRGRFAVFPR